MSYIQVKLVKAVYILKLKSLYKNLAKEILMNIEKTLLRIYSKYKVFFVNLNAFIYFCFVLRNITF